MSGIPTDDNSQFAAQQVGLHPGQYARAQVGSSRCVQQQMYDAIVRRLDVLYEGRRVG